MEPGATGAVPIETARQDALLVPQALLAVTQTLPAVELVVTVMEVVPCPLLMVHPAGTVHV